MRKVLDTHILRHIQLATTNPQDWEGHEDKERETLTDERRLGKHTTWYPELDLRT